MRTATQTMKFTALYERLSRKNHTLKETGAAYANAPVIYLAIFTSIKLLPAIGGSLCLHLTHPLRHVLMTALERTAFISNIFYPIFPSNTSIAFIT